MYPTDRKEFDDRMRTKDEARTRYARHRENRVDRVSDLPRTVVWLIGQVWKLINMMFGLELEPPTMKQEGQTESQSYKYEPAEDVRITYLRHRVANGWEIQTDRGRVYGRRVGEHPDAEDETLTFAYLAYGVDHVSGDNYKDINDCPLYQNVDGQIHNRGVTFKYGDASAEVRYDDIKNMPDAIWQLEVRRDEIRRQKEYDRRRFQTVIDLRMQTIKIGPVDYTTFLLILGLREDMLVYNREIDWLESKIEDARLEFIWGHDWSRL